MVRMASWTSLKVTLAAGIAGRAGAGAGGNGLRMACTAPKTTNPNRITAHLYLTQTSMPPSFRWFCLLSALSNIRKTPVKKNLL
jgi:hypothetical protein